MMRMSSLISRRTRVAWTLSRRSEANPDLSSQIYGPTKLELWKRIRRNAAEPAWAEAGIPLSAVAAGCRWLPVVAPRVVETPMTVNYPGSDEARPHDSTW